MTWHGLVATLPLPYPFDLGFMQRALVACVAVGVFAPMIGRAGRRSFSSRCVAAWMALLLFTDAIYAVMVIKGSYVSGVWVDGGWLIVMFYTPPPFFLLMNLPFAFSMRGRARALHRRFRLSNWQWVGHATAPWSVSVLIDRSPSWY